MLLPRAELRGARGASRPPDDSHYRALMLRRVGLGRSAGAIRGLGAAAPRSLAGLAR